MKILKELKTILTLFLLIIVSQALQASFSSSSAERILFLHSYPLGERGLKLNSGFEKVVRQRFPHAQIRFEVLDYDALLPILVDFNWKRFRTNQTVLPKERARLHKILKEYKPNLLVLSDDEVAEVVHPLPKEVKAPVFVMGMNRPLKSISWYKKDPQRYVGGIEDEKPMVDSLRMLREIMPVRRVAIATSNEMTSNLLIEGTLKAFKAYSKKQVDKYGPDAKVEVVKIVKSSKWSDWKKQLKKIDGEVDLIWMLIPYQVYNSKGEELKVKRIGQWMVNNLGTPTIGISDINVKVGALFAQASDTEMVGKQLGEQVQGYLMSRRVRSIGFERRLGYDFFINRDTAGRFGIDIPKKHLKRLKVIYTSNIREKRGTK